MQAALRISTLERVLRGSARSAPRPAACALLCVVGAALHGLALGGSSGEPLLALYAAVKVPLLLALSSAACLPTFYVVAAVLGLRDDFAASCRALLAAQTALAVVLGATAPVFVFFAASIADSGALTLLDAMLFGAATLAGQTVLSRHYAPLVRRDPRHRIARNGWVVLYVFFAIQLAWVLRPFLGTGGVAFLRESAFEQNAYMILFEHIARLLR